MQDPNDDKNNGLGNESSSGDDHSVQPAIPNVSQVDESLPNEAQFEEPVASPNVTGEEDPSGDAPNGEPMDIDKQLKSVGRVKEEDDQI